jgi:hypothetical protein
MVTAGKPQLDRVLLRRVRGLLHAIGAPVDLQRLVAAGPDDFDHVRLVARRGRRSDRRWVGCEHELPVSMDGKA